MNYRKFPDVPEYVKTLSNPPIKYRGRMPAGADVVPEVSIISAFYNADEYFEETYQSVVGQTMQDFEWLIVDDCSTDQRALDLFDSLPQRSDKIRTFRHDVNRGVSATRNTAISQARGKYLFFLDLDDLIDPTYLEKCVLFLELHPDFSFVNSYNIGFQEQEYWWQSGFERAARFIEENSVTIMLMYRREDFERLGGFDETFRFYEDWERWLKALSEGQKGWTIPEFLHCYRRLDTGLLSTSQRKETRRREALERIKQKYAARFEKNPPSAPRWVEQTTPYDVKNLRKRLAIENVLDNVSLEGKRILFLYPHLEVGGADKYNLDLLALLRAKGYQLTIATTLQANHAWHENFYKITPDIFHLANYSYEHDWLSIIRYLMKSRQIDVFFISNSYFAYYLLPLLRREFPGTAFIDNVHAYDKGWRVDGYPRLSRQFNEYLDAQIVSTGHLAEYNEREEPTAAGKFTVCTTNIDPRQWLFDENERKRIRRLYQVPDDEVLLLFPARLVSQKRPLLFVRIVKRLVENSLPVKAVIIGDGPLIEATRQLIKELELGDSITMAPPVNSAELRSFYCATDIFLSPTEYEGISIAVFEAMAMGLPVVASRVGGQAELVVEGTGYLIPKGEADEGEVDRYFKVLSPLVSDAELRRRIGRAARRRIEDFFTLEKMGENVERVLSAAMARRRNNRATEPELASRLTAEELLIQALECSRLERECAYLHTTLGEIYSRPAGDYEMMKKERDLLLGQKQSMEASRFWKIRQRWFRLKYKMGLSKFDS